jgi:drug/metabolite transporter (DMT)-like permease
VWVVIFFAVIGISFAGALLQQLDEIPPIMRACWRLSLTSFMLMPLAIIDYIKWKDENKVKMRELKTWGIIVASALVLAIHFAGWVASLDLTSLAHSLLFTTSHPLLILIGSAIFVRRPTKLEIIGAIVGMIGAGITLIDIKDDKEVTAEGDALAFLGAAMIVFHIAAGKTLRYWMPTFVYAFPVTFLAAAFLAIFSAMFNEGAAVFGWATSSKVGWFVLLAFVSGIVGHTGFNFALGYVSPIVVSISTTLEPVVGTFLGWILYDSSVPGLWTILGGPLLLVGIFCVILGSERAVQPAQDNNDAEHCITNQIDEELVQQQIAV